MRLLWVAKIVAGSSIVVMVGATSVQAGHFTGPRQTCFASSDVTPMNGVNPSKNNVIQSKVSIHVT